MPPFANDGGIIDEPVMPCNCTDEGVEIDDAYYIDRSMSCIEIEFVQDGEGMFQDRIIFTLPELNIIHSIPLENCPVSGTDNDENDCGANVSKLGEKDKDDDDIIEDEFGVFSIMEDLHSNLDSWLGCQYPTTPGLKSALRKKTDGHNDNQHSIDRNVSFTKLEIKEFNMTLGDHPSATSGPPVMLDWESQPKERVVDLDSYEQARQPRRNRRQLRLSFDDRRNVLEKDRGYSVEEIKKAWKEALLIRQQRHETRKRGPTQTMIDEAWESACRKYQRMFGGIIDTFAFLGIKEFIETTYTTPTDTTEQAITTVVIPSTTTTTPPPTMTTTTTATATAATPTHQLVSV